METQLALLTHHPCCAWIPPPLQRADNKCVGWHLCPEKAMDVSPSLADLVRNMMIAVYVAAFPAGGSVPLPRDSVLSGPHAPTTGHGGTPYPLTRVLSPFSTGLGCSYSSHASRGTHLERSCRADLAFGLAATLYEYTSILREPGGQAQEESAGQQRVLSFLGWSTRATGSGFLVRSRCL